MGNKIVSDIIAVQNIRNTFKFTKYAQGNHLHQSNPDKELLSSKRYHQNYPRNKQEHFEPLTEFSRYSTCHSSSVVEAHFPVPPEIQDGKILCMRECKASNLESSQCTPLNEHVESDASYSCSTFGGIQSWEGKKYLCDTYLSVYCQKLMSLLYADLSLHFEGI